MIHGSRDRSNGLVTFPRSQMIHDLIDNLVRPSANATTVAVLPTPPFIFATAMTFAGTVILCVRD
jgi:hypothetical protein